MKKLIIILTALLIGQPVAIQAETAGKFLVLEAMIASHKSLSNKLKNRNLTEASVMAATQTTTNNTEDYDEIIVTMQKRIEGSFASVQFVADLTALTAMAVKTAKLSTDAVELALDKADKNPLLVEGAAYALNRSGQCINVIYQLIAMVASSGTGVVLATNEDRTQFCFMIRSKLLEVQDIMNRLLMMAMNSDGFLDNTENAATRRIRAVLQGSEDKKAYDETTRIIQTAGNRVK